VRTAPQLSLAETVPQLSPSREQKVALLSGEQPQWLTAPPPPHVCGAVQLPQLAVRAAPQLSVPVRFPQLALPSREQKVALLSALQPQTLGMLPPPQVCGATQTAPLLMKCPMPSHLTGCCPMQLSAPGLQSLQSPVGALHVMQGRGSLTQAVPVALHTCGVMPRQRFARGWQMPVQLPAEHTFGHAPPALSCQWPAPSHVCA
jgi:hypothetical protein